MSGNNLLQPNTKIYRIHIKLDFSIILTAFLSDLPLCTHMTDANWVLNMTALIGWHFVFICLCVCHRHWLTDCQQNPITNTFRPLKWCLFKMSLRLPSFLAELHLSHAISEHTLHSNMPKYGCLSLDTCLLCASRHVWSNADRNDCGSAIMSNHS